VSSNATIALIGLGAAIIGSFTGFYGGILERRHSAGVERDRWAKTQETLELSRRSALELEERRREHVQRAAVEEANARRASSARIAARLLQSELAVARWRLDRTDRLNRFWREDFALPLSDWMLYRETVAEYMPTEGWLDVAACYRSLETTELQARLARDLSNDLRAPLTAPTKEQIRISRRNLKRALEALEGFSGSPPADADEGEEQ
jgi:hypothetical protein